MDKSRFFEEARKLGFCCRENEPMRLHTTFAIGGPAEIFVEVNDSEKLPELIKSAVDCFVPFTVIGNGSNLLVSDNGIDGAVFKMTDSTVTVSGNSVIAAAGAKLSKVCLTACEASLGGMEFAYGIPGSVGGAVFMNAGAYGGEIKGVISSCRSVSCCGTITERRVDELMLGYRTSIYKTCDEKIISANFSLEKKDKAEIKCAMEEFLSRRKDKQPLLFPSAGSTFKRPKGYFAGKLIEDAGLKGFSVGGAKVSEKHAGFVVNNGGATADDVRKLIYEIQNRVEKSSGVWLEPEVIFVGK